LKRNWLLLGLSVLGLGLLPAVCRAEHWTLLGAHPQGDMYLDMDSIIRQDGLTGFWVRRHYYKPQESTVSKMKFRDQWVHQVLDCRKNTMQMNQMIFLDEKGKAVGAYKHLKEPPKPIQPQGFFAKEAKLLCTPGAGPVKNAPTTKSATPKAGPAAPGVTAKSKAVIKSP